MSVESNIALVKSAYVDGMSRRNMDVIRKCFADDYICRFPDGEALNGYPAFIKFLSAFLDAFPDMIFTIEDALGEGDKVTVRWLGVGTHTRPFRAFAPDEAGIPASGNHVRFTANDIYRIDGGKIVEEWNSLTDADVKFQLGVLREA